MDTVPIIKPSNFDFDKDNQLMAKQLELLEKNLSLFTELKDELISSRNTMNHLIQEAGKKKQLILYLKKRLYPPTIKNPYNLEPGNFFSASNDYGNCIVSITGIIQKYSCGQWHELYEYTSSCQSHDGLDTHVTFGQASSVSDVTARYFLSIFSKEF